MRPSSADTSEPACVKRKMLSTNKSTSWLLFVAEVLGDGEPVKPDAQTRAGRLGHLAVDQAPLDFVYPSDRHADSCISSIESLPFAGALAHAGKHRDAAVRLGDVVDQLHDDDGLADAGAAEEADLAALEERLDEVDDLDTGFEHHLRRGLLVKRRSGAVNGQEFLGVHRAHAVHRLAQHVEHAAERLRAYGYGHRLAQADRLHPANQTLGGLERDGTHAALTDMLRHFADEVDRRFGLKAVADDTDSRVDERHLAFGELNVHRGPAT
jgi:peptide chain release factor 1